MFVSAYTAYASTVYNLAIATNDPDLIANAVIILFVTDIDELMDEIKLEIESDWVLEPEDQKQDEEETNQEKHNEKMEEDNKKQDEEEQKEEEEDKDEEDKKVQDE